MSDPKSDPKSASRPFKLHDSGSNASPRFQVEGQKSIAPEDDFSEDPRGSLTEEPDENNIDPSPHPLPLDADDGGKPFKWHSKR